MMTTQTSHGMKKVPDLRGRLAFTLFWTMLLLRRPLRQQNNQVPWETELQSSKVILSTSELQIGSSKNLKSLLFFRKQQRLAFSQAFVRDLVSCGKNSHSIFSDRLIQALCLQDNDLMRKYEPQLSAFLQWSTEKCIQRNVMLSKKPACGR